MLKLGKILSFFLILCSLFFFSDGNLSKDRAVHGAIHVTDELSNS